MIYKFKSKSLDDFLKLMSHIRQPRISSLKIETNSKDLTSDELSIEMETNLNREVLIHFMKRVSKNNLMIKTLEENE